MDKVLTIGRSNDNHLVVKVDRVSSKHCTIRKLPDNEFLVEDIDSSNGTFLNKRRIKQALIRSGDEFNLAGYPMDPNLLLGSFEYSLAKTGVSYEEFRKQELIYIEFAGLKKIYDQYQKEKRHVMKASTLKSTGVRAGLSFIPIVGVALGILSTGVTGNVQEKLMELEEAFKRSYICPGCFKFLGAEPFENMEKRGFCLICKTKWIR